MALKLDSVWHWNCFIFFKVCGICISKIYGAVLLHYRKDTPLGVINLLQVLQPNIMIFQFILYLILFTFVLVVGFVITLYVYYKVRI